MPSIPRDRQWQFRFLIITPTREVNLTSYLTSARFTLGDVSRVGAGAAGSDGLSAVADFTLANDRPNSAALQPSVPESSWNKALDGTTPELLLFPYRRARFEARWRVPGGAWPNWDVLFDGFLGDSIRTDARASTIKLRARDRAKRLMDKYLDTLDAFGAPGGTLVPTVMQALIDSELSPSETLHVIGSPTFMVGAYSPLRVTLWDAVQELAVQMGWFLGYRKDASTGEFQLTLMDPPREKTTPDFVFDAGDVLKADVEQSDRDVRNAVRIYYVDQATRQRTPFPLGGPLVDAASVAALGGVEKLMVIEEGSTSQIDTEAQAEALAQRALHDLSGLMGSTQVTLPFVPELQLFDLVGIDVPSQGVNEAYGVESIQHTLEFGRGFKASTVFTGTNKVTGKRKQWLDRELAPGSPAEPDPNAVRLLPPFVTIEPVEFGAGFAVVTDTGRSRGVRAIGVEVHASPISGFTPGPGTLWARGPESRFLFADASPNGFWFVRVRSYDGDGRYSEYTAEIDAGLVGLPGAVEVHSGLLNQPGVSTPFSYTNPSTYLIRLQTAGGPADYSRLLSSSLGDNLTVPPNKLWVAQWVLADIGLSGDPLPEGISIASIVPPGSRFEARDNSAPPPSVDRPNTDFPMVSGTVYIHAGVRWFREGEPSAITAGAIRLEGFESGDPTVTRTPYTTVAWRILEIDTDV